MLWSVAWAWAEEGGAGGAGPRATSHGLEIETVPKANNIVEVVDGALRLRYYTAYKSHRGGSEGIELKGKSPDNWS